jgi:hypothetical protein
MPKGRPPMSPEGTVMLTVRLPRSILDKLLELKPKGMTMSQYHRVILEMEAQKKQRRKIAKAFFG